MKILYSIYHRAKYILPLLRAKNFILITQEANIKGGFDANLHSNLTSDATICWVLRKAFLQVEAATNSVDSLTNELGIKRDDEEQL
ncbi:hypothetical protein [Spirosoma sp.]|uniref:hypothetical protein n=1 Tax=Spirosoma sp. TaxID=1899569 RepID=UPI0026064240|nr:hypothetical protein [Spirosoma sp.]MCX6217652.1 hypothetical protein [Spirosoma sp.]